MKKLIELGASINAAICAADKYDGGYNFERDRKIRDALMALPTVDAVPVVRCKDCARFDKKRGCNLVDGLNIAKTDSFCSYGERKGGDDVQDKKS